MDGILPDWDGTAGDGVWLFGQRTVSEHDDGSGDGVSGQWAAWLRNGERELAGIYNGEQPGGCSRADDGDHCTGRLCEYQPGSEPGGDAGRSLLYGNLQHEQRDDQHGILGGSG